MSLVRSSQVITPNPGAGVATLVRKQASFRPKATTERAQAAM